jgi:hypothetical protein
MRDCPRRGSSKKIITVAILVLPIIFLIFPAFAQDDGFTQGLYWGYWGATEGMSENIFGADFAAKIKDAQDRLEAIKIWRMTEVLGLSVDQSTEFFPLYKQLEDVREGYYVDREKVIEDMLGLLNESQADNDKIKDKTEELLNTKSTLMDKESEIYKKMRQVLNEVQMGRFLIFEETFQREVLSLIQDIRSGNLSEKQTKDSSVEGGVYNPFKKKESKTNQ